MLEILRCFASRLLHCFQDMQSERIFPIVSSTDHSSSAALKQLEPEQDTNFNNVKKQLTWVLVSACLLHWAV